MSFSERNLLACVNYRSTKPVLIDVGAHHGSFSLPFAKKDWRVIAFEPEQKNREAFERNLAGFEKATCIPKAVSDVTGNSVPFYRSDEHYGIHGLKPFHETHKLAYKVETIRLADILEDLQVPEVTLVKVDTEGADFLALRGFDFKKYRPELLMLEFMDNRSREHYGYTHHDVVEYMNQQGYTTFVSEWEPINEYAREGHVNEPHVWLQCVPYPLDHEPAWGNLIFVPDRDRDKFSVTLDSYLGRLRRYRIAIRLVGNIKKIPGISGLYSLIRGR